MFQVIQSPRSAPRRLTALLALASACALYAGAAQAQVKPKLLAWYRGVDSTNINNQLDNLAHYHFNGVSYNPVYLGVSDNFFNTIASKASSTEYQNQVSSLAQTIRTARTKGVTDWFIRFNAQPVDLT